MAKRAPVRPGEVDGLNHNDPGIRLLSDEVQRSGASAPLLVCCGDLPGMEEASRLVLDARELRRAGANTVPFSRWPQLRGSHDVAVVWPRAHLGKDFTQQCVAVGLTALRDGGRLLCAVRKQKGAQSITDYIGEVFGNVTVLGRDKGYRLLEAVREGDPPEPDILNCRYSFDDPLLGSLRLRSAPGVFSRKGLDMGTRCLLKHVEGLELSPSNIVDLGAGVGPIALWAAERWPRSRVVAVESNFVAAQLLRENVASAELQQRVIAMEHDGLPSTVAAVRHFIGTTDLTLTNPPTHADAGALRALFGPLASWQRNGSVTYAVVSRPEMASTALREAGATLELHRYSSFSVLEARW